MVRNVNNKKSEKPLSPNGLSQVGGGGSEPPLTHNKVDCAYLPNEINSCANEVNEVCENDKLSLAKSSPHPAPLLQGEGTPHFLNNFGEVG